MNDPIKSAIYEELNTILKSPSTSNEERLKQLKFTEGKIIFFRHAHFLSFYSSTGYGIYLAELTLDDTLDLGLRQLASIMLKKYVDDHWCLDDDDQTKLIASDQAKQAIKNIIPKGLYSNNSKIRNTVAYTISSIAGYDWPQDWVELFDIIVGCLAGNEDSGKKEP
jgi:importin-9